MTVTTISPCSDPLYFYSHIVLYVACSVFLTIHIMCPSSAVKYKTNSITCSKMFNYNCTTLFFITRTISHFSIVSTQRSFLRSKHFYHIFYYTFSLLTLQKLVCSGLEKEHTVSRYFLMHKRLAH